MHRRLSNHGNKYPTAESENNYEENEDGTTNATSSSNSSRKNQMMNHKNMMLEIDVAHLGEYDGSLLGYLRESPSAILPELEVAAGKALDSLLYDLRESSSTSHGNTQNEDDDLDNDEGNRSEANENGNNNRTNNNDGRASSEWSIQILLKGNLTSTPLRQIQSQHINRLIKCPGIVISATPIQVRAVKLTVRCNRCMDTHSISATEGPYGNVPLPQRCQGVEPKECGPYPYSIVADESLFSDRQKLKLQESPERVPTGEMPRSVMVAVEKGLVDKAPPGTRVSLFCIPTLFNGGGGAPGQRGGAGAVQKVYLRCVGMSKDQASGEAARFTPAEEEAFQQFSKRADAYEILTRSVAPSIQGSYTVDIKKALVCMLMGGTRKRLPDGMRLRGDINVLLLGDPSTAKSQFLKFVGKTSPIGIYTSGKGSSAAGLTASVVKNAAGEFYLEGGAMVLADGGIVCIDEFDKMRPQDRVAIHEAMEQQTISIAKAGITTVLNSRSAVLAAANPVFGRYDDFKSASENIDLMTTILSRFDMIFLVRDVREEERDLMICRHVMGVHIRGGAPDSNAPSGGPSGTGGLGFLAGLSMGGAGGEGGGDRARSEAQSNTPEAIAENVMRLATTGQGELDVPSMKKYIQYCKSRCKPTLSEEAGQVLTSSYVKIRDDVRKSTLQSLGEDAQATIPITVRQLEALVRISESLAKIRLDSEVRIEDVNEALRLFRVSTMAANSADQANGAGGTGSGNPFLNGAGGNNREEFDRAQGFLRCRLAIGSTVNKQKLIEEGSGQGYDFMTMVRVLSAMAQRGELLERNQGRLLKRIK
ncbi:unnamed protein product [Pseudo-nitzschia multistriata]|uniref:DNA replication licensing factor MCM5 n=1 Tax=Pseudo-nitzschia multistriata TaxID=183589 RepID=A0A448ZRS3_9STRA|nr:unnamed protein product [Pseudo-nitzschia multistriata]